MMPMLLVGICSIEEYAVDAEKVVGKRLVSPVSQCKICLEFFNRTLDF